MINAERWPTPHSRIIVDFSDLVVDYFAHPVRCKAHTLLLAEGDQNDREILLIYVSCVRVVMVVEYVEYNEGSCVESLLHEKQRFRKPGSAEWNRLALIISSSAVSITASGDSHAVCQCLPLFEARTTTRIGCSSLST